MSCYCGLYLWCLFLNLCCIHILVKVKEMEDPPCTLARILNGNFGKYNKNDVPDLFFLMCISGEKDLQNWRKFKNLKSVQFLLHEVVDSVNLLFFIIELKPKLKCARERLPDILVTVFETCYVIVYLLDSSLLWVWLVLFLEMYRDTLTVKFIKILSIPEYWFLPLSLICLLKKLIKALDNLWIHWIYLYLQLNAEKDSLFMNLRRHPTYPCGFIHAITFLLDKVIL